MLQKFIFLSSWRYLQIIKDFKLFQISQIFFSLVVALIFFHLHRHHPIALISVKDRLQEVFIDFTVFTSSQLKFRTGCMNLGVRTLMDHWGKHPFPFPVTDLKHSGKGQVCTGLVFRSEVVRLFSSACRLPLNLHLGHHPSGNSKSDNLLVSTKKAQKDCVWLQVWLSVFASGFIYELNIQ